MIGLTNAGGGFDRLNMRVYGGLDTPSNPRNNDVWVKIEQKKFPYVIDGENASFSTSSGTVRLKLTNKDRYPLMVLKNKAGENNKLYLDFNLCELDIGPSAKVVDAYVRKDNTWKQFSQAVPDWDGTLFYNGNQYTKYTGGWTAVGGGAKVGTNLTLDTGGFAAIRSTSKVDVTKFKTLRFKCASKFSVLGDDHSGFGLKSDGIGWSNCDDNFAAALWNLSGKTEGSLNISSITGSYYVTFFVYPREGYAAGVDVNKIWLE